MSVNGLGNFIVLALEPAPPDGLDRRCAQTLL
jgi:hypothetical protein